MAEKLPVLEQLAKDFEPQRLLDYYKSASPKFRPQNTDVSEVLESIKDPRFESITQIGEIEYDNANRVGFYISPLNKELTEKTSKKIQYDIGKKLLKSDSYDAGIFVFYGANRNFRLSLIAASYLGPKREFTTFRRYTYFVSPELTNITFIKQLSGCKFDSTDDILAAFSIEAVNKDFYTEIAKRFTALTGGSRKIGSKKYEEERSLQLPGRQEETVYKEFAVRLIGRLIFCWFLKKKTSKNNIPLIPENLLSTRAIKPKEGLGGYYHSILEPLFFEVLNTPVEKRKTAYDKESWSTIPFLNGGLFTPHEDDFYALSFNNISEHLSTLVVPDEWIKGLLEIFERYNFTIDENTAVDIELAVEPEMLGRIFENLLAEINPETGETARKATGSYYTPRPIVEYMVDESLKQYLLTKTGLPEEKISSLLSYGDEQTDLDETGKDSVIDALHQIKIVDPACGSGAFPMGILQKILLILQKLDPDSKKWLDKLLSGVPDPMYQKELKRKIDQPNYLHKLGIIRDCIYGVDIQPIAVEISKLRFFLSLVVDENVDDKKPNRGVEHLPNLEFKFVCANTLVGLGGEMFLKMEAHKKIEQLKNIRDEYLRSYGSDKKILEEQFAVIKSELSKMSMNWKQGSEMLLKIASWEPFKHKSCGWFNPEWMFGLKSGFDIVIGNPPYLNVQLLPKEDKEFYSNTYSTFYKRFDIFGLFFELAYSNLAKKGFVTFIVPSQILNNLSYIKLREAILKNRWLGEVLYLGDKIFEAANNDVCVLFLNTLGVDKIKLVNALIFENRTISEVAPNYFEKYDYVISISSDKKGEVIFDKILNSRNPRIIKDFDVFQGIVTGNNEVYLLTKEQIRENKIEKELLHPVLLGRDFEKWYIRNADRQILYVDGDTTIEKYPNALRYLSRFKHELTHNKSADEKSTPWYCLHRPRVKPQLDLIPKIVVQATRNPRLKTRIVATIDEIGIYGTQGVNYIIPTSNSASVYYLVGILNSSLINYLFAKKFLNVAIKAEYLKDTPIPRSDKEQENEVVNLVKNIFRVTNNCDNYPENLGKQAEVKKLENQIDQMVYNLYNLTPEEVAIIENSVKA